MSVMSAKKVKVYVYDSESNKKETRKIVVHRGNVLEDLRSLLPCLRKLEYEDEDGDIITATSEPELTLAVFEEGLATLKAICNTRTNELSPPSSYVSQRNDDQNTEQHTLENPEEQFSSKETSKMVDVNVGEKHGSSKSGLGFLSPPSAKKRREVVNPSNNDERVSIDTKIQSCIEKEKESHVKKFGFPVELKVKVLTGDSLKIECGICCRWISINNFHSKNICHLRDHFNTSLHLSNTELQKSRVENHSAELPKLQANREILRLSYPKVFDLVGNKAQCKYCMKDGIIDLLPKTGGLEQRVEAHLASKCHQNMIATSCGKVQGRLNFQKINPSGSK